MYQFNIEAYDISKQLNQFWKEKESFIMPVFTFKMLVNTHTPACLFLILSAEMKDRSGTKDQLRAFCFSHPNLLLYFYSSRICGISPLWETTQQLGPLCHLSTASGGAQKEPGAVAEQQFQFEYSYLTLQTTVDTSKPCVRQNDVKLSIIKPLFSHTPEMSCS